MRRLFDTATEIKGHRKFTRDIKNAQASGDEAAKATFRTGTLAAALTTKGREARGAEVSEYVAKATADGDTDRIDWLRRG